MTSTAGIDSGIELSMRARPATEGVHVSPPPREPSKWLLALRRGAAKPALYLEEVAVLPRFRLQSLFVEMMIFAVLLVTFEVWALADPSNWPIIFLPFAVVRLFQLVFDIGEVACGRPWGPVTLAMSNSGTYFVPRLLRIVDGGSIVLGFLMGLFAYLTMNMTAGVTQAGQFSYVTALFPVWLGTAIQFALLTLVAIAACMGGVTVPPDMFAGRRPFGRPYSQVVVFALYSRILVLLFNLTSVPLALVLQKTPGVTWSAFFYSLGGLALFAAAFPAAVLISSLLQDKLLPPGEALQGQAGLYSKARRHTARQLLALLSINTLMGLATVFIGDEQQKRIASLNSGATGTPPDEETVSMIPTLTLALLTSITFVISGYVALAFIIPTWRLSYAAALGMPTPETAEFMAIRAAMQRTMETVAAEQERRAAILSRARLPYPSVLVKIGYHRYRRLEAGDDIAVLSKATPPPPVTPSATEVALASPALGTASLGRKSAAGMLQSPLARRILGAGSPLLASPVPSSPALVHGPARGTGMVGMAAVAHRVSKTGSSASEANAWRDESKELEEDAVRQNLLSPQERQAGSSRGRVPSGRSKKAWPESAKASARIASAVSPRVEPPPVGRRRRAQSFSCVEELERARLRMTRQRSGLQLSTPSIDKPLACGVSAVRQAATALSINVDNAATSLEQGPAGQYSCQQEEDGKAEESVLADGQGLQPLDRRNPNFAGKLRQFAVSSPNAQPRSVTAAASEGSGSSLRRQALLKRSQTERLLLQLPRPRHDEPLHSSLALPVAAATAVGSSAVRSPVPSAEPVKRSPQVSKLAHPSAPVMSPGSVNLCRVCFDSEANVVLMECGHGGICTGCAAKIVKSTEPGFARCPLCRTLVDSVVLIPPPSTHDSRIVHTLPPGDSDDDEGGGLARRRVPTPAATQQTAVNSSDSAVADASTGFPGQPSSGTSERVQRSRRSRRASASALLGGSPSTSPGGATPDTVGMQAMATATAIRRTPTTALASGLASVTDAARGGAQVSGLQSGDAGVVPAAMTSP